MAAPLNSNLMGAAVLRRAGQKARQGTVNYSGTGSGGTAPQTEQRPGAAIPQQNPSSGMTTAVRATKTMARPSANPAPAVSVQRTAVPFNAGAQQRASYAAGAPMGVPRATAAAPPMQPAGPQVKARPPGYGLPGASGPRDALNIQRAGAPAVQVQPPMTASGPRDMVNVQRAPQELTLSAYDPGAGREAADQSLVRQVAASTAGAGDLGGLPFLGDAAAAGRTVAGLPGMESLRGLDDLFSSGGAGASAGNYSDLVGRIGGALFDPNAELAGQMADSVNKRVEDFDEKYMGEYDTASEEIRDAGSALLDPAAQAAAEAAARDSMYAGINRQRDTAVGQMLDRANRGGRTGSGSTQAAYDSAISAAQEGERGLIQDAFGRRLQATGAGANILGQGAGMDYQKIRDLYSDPQKMLELIMAMGPDFVDALFPL